MSFANNDSSTSPFPMWIPFISPSRLIAVGRTSGTMLSKSGERRHPCLVPDLRGTAFCFHPLSVMLAVGLSYMAFIMLRYVPSFPTVLRDFTINGCWILSNASIDIITWSILESVPCALGTLLFSGGTPPTPQLKCLS